MHNDDYDDHYLDALHYLMGSLSDDMEVDPDEEYPPMIGMSKWLQQEAEAAAANAFPNTTVDWDRIYPTQTCSHEWKVYNGFTETFEFCQKCDVKK